ncbi:hypothetical protein H4R21_004411, partial [Coemansia helicoidea]
MAFLSLSGCHFGPGAAYAAVDGLVLVLALLAVAATGRSGILARAYNRTAIACVAAASVALVSDYDRQDAVSYLRLMALLALPLITPRRWGSVVAQLYNALNVHRAMTTADGGPWTRVVSAMLYAVPMLTCLDAQAHAALRTLAKRAFFVREIQLIRLGWQRPLVLGDVWKLPERFGLFTIQREFKYNVEEPMFLLRAVARMVWRPLLPLLTIRFLMELGDVVKAMVTGYLLQCFDSASEYPWYHGYGIALVLLVIKVACMQKSRVEDLIEREFFRVETAVRLELFRLPLEPNGQRKLADIRVSSRVMSNLPRHLTQLARTCVRILGLWPKFAVLYYIVGWLAVIPIASSVMMMAINWGFALLVGTSDYWSIDSDNCDERVSEVYQGIKAIKLFGWERMYLDPKLQEQDSDATRLPWYAPAIRIAWFIIDTASSASLSFTSFILFYAHVQSPAFIASALTSAYVLELSSH